MADNNDTNSSTDELAGHKAKNTELMGKLKTATNSVTTLQDRLTALEEAANEAADTTKTEVEKAEAKAAREINRLKADLVSRDTQLSTLLIDNEIKAAIAKNGVLAHSVELVEAYLRAGVKMENGEAIATGGIPLADRIANYFASEQAKHVIAAPNNTGAGARGSSSTAIGKAPETAEEYNAFMKLATDDPAQANALAAQWGRADLKTG